MSQLHSTKHSTGLQHQIEIKEKLHPNTQSSSINLGRQNVILAIERVDDRSRKQYTGRRISVTVHQFPITP